ncbi:MAG: sulfate transporter family protein [Pseudomonadota bacterium]
MTEGSAVLADQTDEQTPLGLPQFAAHMLVITKNSWTDAVLQTAVSRTLNQIFTPPFRSVLWKSIGITIALLVGLWFVLEAVVSTFLLPFLGPWPWLTTSITWLLGTGLLVGMGFLIAPVSSMFAGVFLDDIADAVEGKHYTADLPGRAVPLSKSIMMTLKFLLLVAGANLAALTLVLFFGLGVIVFFVVNGYLLGREYFQFAALRHMDIAEADKLRKDNAGTIFLGGLLIAGLLAIPFANLLTPLFAGALMVHVCKGLAVEREATTLHAA